MKKRDFRPHNVSRSNCGVTGSTPQLRSSTNQSTSQPTAYPYPASNSVNSSSNSKSNSNVVTITRCPTTASTGSNAQGGSSFLTRIPASTTITPTQYYNGKDSSLSSALSIYPKNSQSANTRSIIQSSVSPVIASPTRASPQAGYAKQPSISPASSMHIPAVIQQQIDELLLKQNFGGLANPELLKETILTYNSMYAKAQQQNALAGNQSLSSPNNHSSYPIRNKSVITTSRASAMDVIDLSASNSPTSSRSMSAVAALQLQQAQTASAANKRAQNGQYLNGNQSSRSMQSSSSSSASTRLQQQQMEMQNLYTNAYKIEKTFIENQMVHCINMIPYSPNSDMIIPLSEMRDQFYPNANLDVCKRVMQALDINLYSGTK